MRLDGRMKVQKQNENNNAGWNNPNTHTQLSNKRRLSAVETLTHSFCSTQTMRYFTYQGSVSSTNNSTAQSPFRIQHPPSTCWTLCLHLSFISCFLSGWHLQKKQKNLETWCKLFLYCSNFILLCLSDFLFLVPALHIQLLERWVNQQQTISNRFNNWNILIRSIFFMLKSQTFAGVDKTTH